MSVVGVYIGCGGLDGRERVLGGGELSVRRGSDLDEVVSVYTWTRHALWMASELPSWPRTASGVRSLS